VRIAAGITSSPLCPLLLFRTLHKKTGLTLLSASNLQPDFPRGDRSFASPGCPGFALSIIARCGSCCPDAFYYVLALASTKKPEHYLKRRPEGSETFALSNNAPVL
jgi:hypothetical protein